MMTLSFLQPFLLYSMIAVQGGIANECPENYPGSNDNYLSYKGLNRWITDLNNDFFLEEDTIKATLTYYHPNSDGKTTEIKYDLSNSTKNIVLPYGSYVTLTISYPQTWSLWSSLIGTEKHTSTMSVTKPAVTDYISYTDKNYEY